MNGHPEIPPELLQTAVPRFRGLGDWKGVLRNGLSINSPTCLFETTTGTWFAKLESLTDRSETALGHEHRIINVLVRQGFPAPAVVATENDGTWLPADDHALVVTALARGDDRYGDVPVFAPFHTLPEAREAGACLARLHRLSPVMPPEAARPWHGMTAQCRVLRDRDGAATVTRWRLEQPALAARLDQPEVQTRFRDYVNRHLGHLADRGESWPVGVIHGDFIKRNLFWQGETITSVIDFGLWNVGPWLLDLVLALIPCAFDWPELLAGRGEVRRDHLQAMLAGYDSIRPLTASERAGIRALLPLARLEFYLGIVAWADERGDREQAQRFWELLNRTMAWFDAHDWEQALS